MAEIVIRGELAQRLRDIAARENRAVEDVLRSMIDLYLRSQDEAALAASESIEDTE